MGPDCEVVYYAALLAWVVAMWMPMRRRSGSATT
jgi:hypothetical protein